jgi:hypothetical protein
MSNLVHFQAGDMVPLNAARVARVLEQEVRSRRFLIARGRIPDIIPNRDPVLRILAPAAGSQYTDERVYEAMRLNEHKVADSRRHLESEIFAHEFEVQAGPSRSDRAVLFEAFAEQLWTRIPNRRTVLKRLHDSYYFGWVPLQIIVDRDTRFQGRPVWMPRKLINKPHYQVRRTDRDTVVFLGDSWGEPIEFADAEADLGWLLWRIGDLDHEYGEGLHRMAWLLHYAKRQVGRKFQKGLDRQFGLTMVKQSDMSDQAGDLDQIREELEPIIELLNQHNIALSARGFTLDFLTQSNFIASGLDVLRYFDEQIMTLYCGEILTSNPGDRGTQALGTVQRSVKTDYAKDAALESVEDPITLLFRKFIEANYGQQAEEDYPRFVSRLRLLVNTEQVRVLFDMGAPIRLNRLAELQGLQSIIATGQESDDEIVIKKQQQSPFAGLAEQLRAQPPTEEDEGEDDEDEPEEAEQSGRRLRVV